MLTNVLSDALPVSLIGMNSKLMCQYSKFVTDHLLVTFGDEMLYNMTNSFDFMEMISLQGKTNFFKKRGSEYLKAGVNALAQSTTSEVTSLKTL